MRAQNIFFHIFSGCFSLLSFLDYVKKSLKKFYLHVAVLHCAAVQQRESYIYIHFFRFPLHLGLHRALSRVPCVLTTFLKSRFLFNFIRTTTFIKFILFVLKHLSTLSYTSSLSDQLYANITYDFQIQTSNRICSSKNTCGKKWVKELIGTQ